MDNSGRHFNILIFIPFPKPHCVCTAALAFEDTAFQKAPPYLSAPETLSPGGITDAKISNFSASRSSHMETLWYHYLCHLCHVSAVASSLSQVLFVCVCVCGGGVASLRFAPWSKSTHPPVVSLPVRFLALSTGVSPMLKHHSHSAIPASLAGARVYHDRAQAGVSCVTGVFFLISRRVWDPRPQSTANDRRIASCWR